MNNSESLSESIDDDHFIIGSTAKGSQNSTPQSIPRSRFTILSDITQTNKKNHKQEELLSRYLKDLHEEHNKNEKEEPLHYNKHEIPNFQMKLLVENKNR